MEFTAEIKQILELSYEGDETSRRRRLALEKLNLNPGDTVLDLGCGNGLMTVELARAVGPNGKIIGVDPSDEMRSSAVLRCKDMPWVELMHGNATNIPLDTNSIDRAVSNQVFEYIEDIPKALQELHRVLKDNATLVIGDHHWDSWVWYSDKPERMARVMKAWDEHLAERCIPAIIPPLLRDAGFSVESMHPFAHCDYQLKPDGLANALLALIESYVLSQGLLPEEEVMAWKEEQLELAAAGRFYFLLTHCVVVARKR